MGPFVTRRWVSFEKKLFWNNNRFTDSCPKKKKNVQKITCTFHSALSPMMTSCINWRTLSDWACACVSVSVSLCSFITCAASSNHRYRAPSCYPIKATPTSSWHFLPRLQPLATANLHIYNLILSKPLFERIYIVCNVFEIGCFHKASPEDPSHSFIPLEIHPHWFLILVKTVGSICVDDRTVWFMTLLLLSIFPYLKF